MKCEELIHYLSEYIDQELDENLREEARRHLAECDNCRIVYDSTRKTILLYHQENREVIPIDRRGPLYDRIKNAIEECEDIKNKQEEK